LNLGFQSLRFTSLSAARKGLTQPNRWVFCACLSASFAIGQTRGLQDVDIRADLCDIQTLRCTCLHAARKGFNPVFIGWVFCFWSRLEEM
jgi:hypothetical protein